MTITYGSVCSGIEAASVAWHPLGMKADWLAEIEPFPSAVLARHYPDTPNHGDMTKLAALVLARKIQAPDVLVGGTPCQAFSVAGMRQGLLDPRGALTIKYVELADAIDYVRALDRKPPAVTVWENVPGVISDKGNAFGCFLGALAGEDSELHPSGKRWADAGCVYGPKRAIAWRILDAQHFGLAQRRRRVFVVASAREGFDPASVLFERDGLRRDSPPRRGEVKAVAALTANGVGTCGADDNQAQAGHLIAGALNANGKAAGIATQQDAEAGLLAVHGTQDPGTSEHLAFALGRKHGQENAVLAFTCKDYGADAGTIAPTLRAMGHNSSHANAGGQLAVCVTGDITHTLKAEGFDASEDGTGRGQPMIPVGQSVRRLTPVECERLQGFPEVKKHVIITVNKYSGVNTCSDHQPSFAPAETKNLKSQSNALNAGENEYQSRASHAENDLNADQESSSEAVLVSVLIDLERQNLQLRSQGKSLFSASIADKSAWFLPHILIGDFVQLAVATLSELERSRPTGKAAQQPTMIGSFPLKSGNWSASQCGLGIEEFASDAEKFTEAVKSCITFTTSRAGQNFQACEQNFQTLLCCVSTAISSFIPDGIRITSSYALSIEVSHGYTLIPWRNKPANECPDGPRYKAIGNSKAVPVVRWIGKRLIAALQADH